MAEKKMTEVLIKSIHLGFRMWINFTTQCLELNLQLIRDNSTGLAKEKKNLQGLDGWSGIGAMEDLHALKQVVELQEVGLTDGQICGE